MEVFGITPAHLKSGLNIRKLFRGDADDEERVSILLNDILKGEKIEGDEFCFRKRDKEEMVALVYISHSGCRGSHRGKAKHHRYY